MQTAAAGCRWNGCSERGHAQVARTNRTPETEAGGGGRQAGVSGDQSSDHSETLDTTTKSIRAQDGTTQRIGPAWRPVIGRFLFSSFLFLVRSLFLPFFFRCSFFLLLFELLFGAGRMCQAVKPWTMSSVRKTKADSEVPGRSQRLVGVGEIGRAWLHRARIIRGWAPARYELPTRG